MVDSGALDALVICLEEFDPGVKESAAWALGYIARHNGGELAEYCIPVWLEISTFSATYFYWRNLDLAYGDFYAGAVPLLVIFSYCHYVIAC